MGDFLKVWIDLGRMSKQLPIGILQHHFANYDPADLKCLEESIQHFHMKDLEASDYRSAYHQFSDWLYGWNVSDESDENHGKRRPRDIHIEFDREVVDAQRLMKTFDTLASLSLRHLKVCYSDIEAEMPRLGQGLDTFTNIRKPAEGAHDEEELAAGGKALEKVWGNNMDDDDFLGSIAGSIAGSVKGSVKGSQTINIGTEEENLEIMRSVINMDKVGETNFAVEDPENSHSNIGSRAGLFELVNSQDSLEKSLTGSRKDSFGFLANIDSDKREDKTKTGSSTPVEEVAPGFEGQEIDEPQKALQRDVNHVFREIDTSVEYTLLTLCSIAAILAFAELLGDKEMFSKASICAHELSRDFISNTLKTVWDLLNKELPQQTTLSAIRNPNELKVLLQTLINLRAVNGVPPKLRMQKLHHKFATLHTFFTLVDIHLFPNFANAHKEGLKCAQFSAFDSNLWLTGGYDCIIKITDIRESNKHICLAQYVGHKSIITDLHFTHDDEQIVSSSFDRTIKIWNSRTAFPDKTLTGHTDAVTSCDVSSDGRYIASGSLDNTIRFWDFATGECITIIKKHTRWIKIVRFSPDARYLATAGMDRKIYLWDTKILANSRSPSHSRLLDNFNDYVLDMVLFKPSYLLACSRDSTIRLFDYISGHELQNISLSPSWACTLSLSQNGEYFATGSFDNNVNIFRIKDFVKVREIRVFNLGILCIRFPTDLGYLLVGTSEGFMQQIEL